MSFLQFIWCHVFHIFVLFVGDFAFKVAPRYIAEVLSSVPKHRKTVTYLMEKMYVLDKPHSGMSYKCCWLMNQLYMLNKAPLNKNTDKTRLYIDGWEKNDMTRGL